MSPAPTSGLTCKVVTPNRSFHSFRISKPPPPGVNCGMTPEDCARYYSCQFIPGDGGRLAELFRASVGGDGRSVHFFVCGAASLRAGFTFPSGYRTTLSCTSSLLSHPPIIPLAPLVLSILSPSRHTAAQTPRCRSSGWRNATPASSKSTCIRPPS